MKFQIITAIFTKKKCTNENGSFTFIIFARHQTTWNYLYTQKLSSLKWHWVKCDKRSSINVIERLTGQLWPYFVQITRIPPAPSQQRRKMHLRMPQSNQILANMAKVAHIPERINDGGRKKNGCSRNPLEEERKIMAHANLCVRGGPPVCAYKMSKPNYGSFNERNLWMTDVVVSGSSASWRLLTAASWRRNQEQKKSS